MVLPTARNDAVELRRYATKELLEVVFPATWTVEPIGKLLVF
jgi:hypothetical protein